VSAKIDPKMNIGYVRSRYFEENKDCEERSRLLQFYVFRPLSFYLTWIFIKLGISANQATYISILSGFCGLIFLIIGGYNNRIIGLLLLHLWLLIDNVDGNIARCNKSATEYGKLIDILNDQIFHFLFISMGIGLFVDQDKSIKLLEQYFQINSKFFILVLGSWASLISAMIVLAYQKFINEFRMIILPDLLNSKRIKGGRTLSWIKALIYSIFRSSDMILPFAFIACILGYLDLFILSYAIINTSIFVFLVLRFLQLVKSL